MFKEEENLLSEEIMEFIGSFHEKFVDKINNLDNEKLKLANAIGAASLFNTLILVSLNLIDENKQYHIKRIYESTIRVSDFYLQIIKNNESKKHQD